MNLLKRTWAAGARPIGAPGWPELALEVASTCIGVSIAISELPGWIADGCGEAQKILGNGGVTGNIRRGCGWC
jgi:hypothetical protein